MTRTYKKLRHDSLVGGSNNAGAAGPAEEAGASDIGDNANDFVRANIDIDTFKSFLFGYIGCVSDDEVENTKCLFKFMLINEGGILPTIIGMVKISRDIGLIKGDARNFRDYHIKIVGKNNHTNHINQISGRGEKEQTEFMNMITEKVLERVNYNIPDNSIASLFNLKNILYTTVTPKKSLFSRTPREKIYFNPVIINILAKKFFAKIRKITSKTEKKIVENIITGLELTLRDFFRCRTGTEPEVNAILHDIRGEVLRLQMQDAAHQADLATLHQRLGITKADIAEAEAREAREADEGVAQLQRRLAIHKRGEAGTKRKGPRAEGVNKTSMKKKRISSKGLSKKKKGEKGSFKKQPTKRKRSKKKK